MTLYHLPVCVCVCPSRALTLTLTLSLTPFDSPHVILCSFFNRSVSPRTPTGMGAAIDEIPTPSSTHSDEAPAGGLDALLASLQGIDQLRKQQDGGHGTGRGSTNANKNARGSMHSGSDRSADSPSDASDVTYSDDYEDDDAEVGEQDDSMALTGIMANLVSVEDIRKSQAGEHNRDDTPSSLYTVWYFLASTCMCVCVRVCVCVCVHERVGMCP